MRFNLVDRILEVQPGQAIRVARYLTLGEEYLADHFPTFPVMPGVLMLEALAEAGAWLVRITEDFEHSVVVLREARNVKYGTFVEPGRQLVLTAEWTESDAGRATFKGKGEIDGNPAVSARFALARYNLRDRDPSLRAADERLLAHWRSLYTVLSAECRVLSAE